MLQHRSSSFGLSLSVCALGAWGSKIPVALHKKAGPFPNLLLQNNHWDYSINHLDLATTSSSNHTYFNRYNLLHSGYTSTMCQLDRQRYLCGHDTPQPLWIPETADACQNARTIASYDKNGDLRRCTGKYRSPDASTTVPGYCTGTWNAVRRGDCHVAVLELCGWKCSLCEIWSCETTMREAFPLSWNRVSATCTECGQRFDPLVDTINYGPALEHAAILEPL